MDNPNLPAPYVTTAANGELAVAIPVDVDLYGAGVVLFYGRPRLDEPADVARLRSPRPLQPMPGPDQGAHRAALAQARAFVQGREDELEAMLAAARAELAKGAA